VGSRLASQASSRQVDSRDSHWGEAQVSSRQVDSRGNHQEEALISRLWARPVTCPLEGRM
jgi:hypothetical protein